MEQRYMGKSCAGRMRVYESEGREFGECTLTIHVTLRCTRYEIGLGAHRRPAG